MEIQAKRGQMAKRMIMIIVTLSASLLPASAAYPDAPREDVFGRTTAAPPTAKPPMRGHASTTSVRIAPSAPAPKVPHPPVSASSTPQQWFDAFDTYVVVLGPSQGDKVLMNKPFNQEVERVTQFCNTVSKIARNYRILAHTLKSLPLPVAMPDPKVKTYRDQMVDWYNDSALVYEDMIRPRPAARTKEELNGMIQDIKDRSENLKQTLAMLQEMDQDIRREYHVNPPKGDDALGDYTGHH
jgi:hypothetical protein